MPVRVIPGLSSSIVVSGHIPPDHPDSLGDWEALGRLHGTLVLLMAVTNAGAIAGALLAAGRPADTQAGVVADGSLPTQRTVRTTLAALAPAFAAEAIRPPALIAIGDVVAPRPDREGVVDNHYETAGSLPSCDGMRKPVKFRHGRATVKPPPPGGRQVRPSPSRRSNDQGTHDPTRRHL